MLRGQGYNGASNMGGEYNGLKALILKENESAHYIHCFAHQLQLALMKVARKHVLIDGIFNLISDIVNVVGAPCKRQDTLRELQVSRIVASPENEEILSGRGLNQETYLSRPGDTRWGSHYRTLNGFIIVFASVIDVLDVIVDDVLVLDKKFEASRLLEAIQSFEFVITLNLMQTLLGITNDLSQALQRKYQDIENVMRLVDISKQRLQSLMDDGWSSLLDVSSKFSGKHFIQVPNIYICSSRKITTQN